MVTQYGEADLCVYLRGSSTLESGAAGGEFGGLDTAGTEEKTGLLHLQGRQQGLNIDGLHQESGSTAVELHGSLWKTRCLTCENVEENRDMPICPALDGKGAPDVDVKDARIPTIELPRCKKCNGLLRPHVVWFGESLFPEVLKQAYDALYHCDLLLVVGTSAVVQPAAGFAPIVKGGGGYVAEFNIEDTPISRACSFKFQGKSGETLVRALGLGLDELGQTEATTS